MLVYFCCLAVEDVEVCELSIYLSQEYFRYFRVFEFLHNKSDARTLLEASGFWLQLNGCNHEVMIDADVGAWERSCVCLVDTILDACWYQDEFSLVVNLPIRGMPVCCSIRLVRVESVAKRESVAFREL